MLRVSKNFNIVEFIPQEIYTRYGDSAIRFINKDLIKIAQFIRDRFNNTVVINDWYYGGVYNESGFRTPDSNTGANLSAHKRGMAIDIKIEGYSSEYIRQDIIQNYDVYREYGVTAIELDTVGWVHISVENFNKDELELIPIK